MKIQKIRMYILSSIVCVVASCTLSFSQNYPFPNNYLYPYGNIYTGTDVQSKIQGLYNAWKTTYYVEGAMTGGLQSGNPAARILYKKSGFDGSETVSEGIGYGMLAAVYMDNANNNTQSMFNRLWTFYKGNMNSHGLMNSKVLGFTAEVASGTENSYSNTGADIDVAQALLMAHKQWGSAGAINYITEARALIDSIYVHAVDANNILKSSDGFNGYANPSNYITHAIDLFGKVEVVEGWQATNRWNAVVSACYSLMKTSRNATTGLVPDWCETPSGNSISGIVDDTYQSYFLYNAIRIPWRMAQAYAWYGHIDAKDVASKITMWAQVNYSDPSTTWDGYLLNGVAFNNPTGNAAFSGYGTQHNPCFSGGLSIGAMVDNSLSSYMAKCWNVGSATDNFGDYYTHSTQLLYMLTLSGNMPNLFEMKPIPTSAETNENGNVVYVDFSKPLSLTTSTTGWTVQTYANESDATPTTMNVSSLSVSDKRVSIQLTAEIQEPLIKISYNGTTIKSSEDNFTANAISDYVVVNKITSFEPYPILRYANISGTIIQIQWNKEIKESSINGGFSVKINGTEVTIGTPTLDSENATIINIPLSGTIINSNSDVVTVSFAGGSITGLTSTKTAQAFIDAPVQLPYCCSTSCYTITNFDDTKNVTFASWIAGVWNSAGIDPTNNLNTIGYFNGDNATNYLSAKATFSAANKAAFGAALAEQGAQFKAKLYAKSGTFAAGEQIKIVFAHAALADAGSYYDPNQVQLLITPLSFDTWFEVDLPINGVVDNTYDYIQITGSNIDKTGNKTNAEFYIDDMQICEALPQYIYVSSMTRYDGAAIEVRFSSAMNVPTNTDEIVVMANGTPVPVSSISSKQGDVTILVLNLATPITSPQDQITVSGGNSSGLVSANNTQIELFTSKPVANLIGIHAVQGWRDTFNSTTDNLTNAISVGIAWATPAPQEITSGDGIYRIVGNGAVAWSSIDVTTWNNNQNSTLHEVMDLTGRETVQIRYRIPTAVSTKLYLRIDAVDFTNKLASDKMTFVEIPISTSWETQTIDISKFFVNQFSGGSIDIVDRSTIYQVRFYFIEKEGTSATNYVPTNFKGTIEFDYISIGSFVPVPVTSISLPSTLALNIGSTLTLTPIFTPTNATNRAVTWSSSSPAIATIDGNGVITALSVGTTVITVTTSDGGYTASSVLTVTSPFIQPEVSITPSTLALSLASSPTQLQYTVSPSPQNIDNVMWGSSNYNIVSVNSNGIVTPVGQGEATITVVVSVGGQLISATCQVTVSSIPVSSISITPATISLNPQEVIQLQAAILPIHATNKAIVWTSSDPLVAAVSSNGLVTALKEGTSTISAISLDGSSITANATITVNAVSTNPCDHIQVFAAIANVKCYGDQTGIISLISNGGVAPYSYKWSNTSTDAALQNVAANTYSVTVTDSEGCSVVKTYTITEPAPLELTPTIVEPACGLSNGSVTLQMSGGTSPYTYTWNSQASVSVISNIGAGNYSVEVTDAKGCALQKTVQVKNNGAPTLVLESVTSTACNQNKGSISIGVSGGTLPYSYMWNDDATTEDRENIAAGTYTVSVTDNNGCIAVLDAEVPTQSLLQPTIALVTVDTLTGNNRIVWQKEETDMIDFYTVYRENSIAGEYTEIGTQEYALQSIFDDATANSNERSWRYKISATDVCGNETPLSPEHKTIHLQKNISTDKTVNLDWDGYEGIHFLTYNIYRIYTNNTKELITKLPSTITRYSDNAKLENVKSYIVEIDLPEAIDVNEYVLKSESEMFASAYSNTTDIISQYVPVLSHSVAVYPTVANDYVYVHVSNIPEYSITLFDQAGKLVYTAVCSGATIQAIDISKLPQATYNIRIESSNLELFKSRIVVK